MQWLIKFNVEVEIGNPPILKPRRPRGIISNRGDGCAGGWQ